MGRPISPEAAKQIADTVFAGRKIAAIKLYREHSGEGLKEAKDFVEALETELRVKEPGRFVSRPSGKGCLGLLVLCGAGVLSILVLAIILRH